jgi:hypothetical protein
MGPIVYLLETALEVVVTYITYIANFLTGLANILTGIMTGNGDLILKGLKQVMYALAQALMYPFQVLANLIGDLIDWLMGPGDQIAPIVILPNVANFAVGTGNVPTDMAANIHKGEGIIPASFMDSIRKGDLALTSGSMGGRGNMNVYVTVEGSVQAERDLARSIASEVNYLVKKGHA